jgi:hypothetical protein
VFLDSGPVGKPLLANAIPAMPGADPGVAE